MTIQIEVTRQGSKKIIKDAITGQPRSYDTIQEAQAAADSHFALWRCDYKTQGRRAPTYRFVETA
jgi:hypothetical protein